MDEEIDIYKFNNLDDADLERKYKQSLNMNNDNLISNNSGKPSLYSSPPPKHNKYSSNALDEACKEEVDEKSEDEIQ